MKLSLLTCRSPQIWDCDWLSISLSLIENSPIARIYLMLNRQHYFFKFWIQECSTNSFDEWNGRHTLKDCSYVNPLWLYKHVLWEKKISQNFTTQPSHITKPNCATKKYHSQFYGLFVNFQVCHWIAGWPFNEGLLTTVFIIRLVRNFPEIIW